MGSWYSSPYKDSLIKAVEELYGLELPDAIALLIICFELNGLECPGQEFLEFSAEDVGNEKTYHLNIKLLQHSSRWISGAGILFRHPLDCHFGTWILEMKIITRDHGMGIGVFDLTKVKKGKYALHMDVEKSDGWCGYYNGGETVNVCANGKRLHSNIFKNNENMQASHMWSSGEMVGVCVDFDQRKLVPVHRISNQKKEEEKKRKTVKAIHIQIKRIRIILQTNLNS